MNEAMLRNLTPDELERHFWITEPYSPIHNAVCSVIDEREELENRYCELEGVGGNLDRIRDHVNEVITRQEEINHHANMGSDYEDLKSMVIDLTAESISKCDAVITAADEISAQISLL
tara:strand:- start:880 stop:1233 length:354 start_codon:yes stop_codon:yes gene_type:complete